MVGPVGEQERSVGCSKLQWARSNAGLEKEFMDGLSCICRLFKKAVQQGRSEQRPEAYPLGRTVRRIRSTRSVRAAEW